MKPNPATIHHAEAVVRDGALYSPGFDDIYHSISGAVEESQHVFIEGNGLTQRLKEARDFTIIETGFGCGLNFLSTWNTLRQSAPGCRLDFVSVEKHPFTRDDLARVLREWPQFSELVDQLLAAYPPLVPGFHRLHFDDGRVTLTLLFGDALEMLEELDARADAFFLDGFAPAKNADMWSDALFRQIGRLSAEGATAATYSVAAVVRRGLENAGFSVEKRAGFARKREMFVGRRPGQRQASSSPCKVVVVGAGITGASCAFALARRGIQVVLLDRETSAGNAASGNPAAIVRPFVTLDGGVRSRFGWAAFLYAVRLYRELNGQAGFAWNETGVLQLARDPAHLEKLSRGIERNAYPPELARMVDASHSAVLAGVPVSEQGVWFPDAGFVDGSALCRALVEIASQSACFQIQGNAEGMRSGSGSVQITGSKGRILESGDKLILANGVGAQALIPGGAPWLSAVRGQVTAIGAAAPQLRMPVCRDGYITPVIGDRHFVGATFDESRSDANLNDADHQANLLRAALILPGVLDDPGDARVEAGWAAARCVSPDRLPAVGPLDENSFYCVAMGSRGFGWAPLLAEYLASHITGAPAPLERSVLQGLSAARFASSVRHGDMP
ncbi:MAG TPA: bifunctional tRNA (5-methylaminomethyl-2-thiouridine)(34)-methyltransferase MnmD/FAD-dependent 5-carboxymethylaminomethyl-2-thiouridine(34) oxidoreductase MnmC [Burkholderiales bacterium]|nr:bifunctional tRNA (5-methylaminomethyl-2-thiouridine)(34)-methyltransferase MnmD/FAD-dependent 5-carboxymethylaminomethyl-2-thiouridine(34) oxidoreductase MnmC [Burkholderiales bacterium]